MQDPYSLRCQPQVMGACLDQMRRVADVLLTEANAVSDNPLVFAHEGEIVSGGNFHAEPVAFAADDLALAIAEIGALSERRIALLMDTHLSGLPPFLVEDGGVNSGFMIAQVTAAALASENKSLAHPASRRFAADLGEPGGPRQHGDVRGAAALADGREHRADRRDRAPRRRAGRRAAAAARDVGEARRGDRGDPRARCRFWDRDRAFAPDLEAIRLQVERGEFRIICRRAARVTPRGERATIASAPPSGDSPCIVTIPKPLASAARGTRYADRVDPRAARHRTHREVLAHRGGAADDPEQPRSRGRREPEGARRLRRHRPRGAQLGVLRRDLSRRCARSTTTSRC